MERRTFLGVIAGGLLAALLAVGAQRPAKVAFLAPNQFLGKFPEVYPGDPDAPYALAFREGLAESGWIVGRNTTIEVKSANGCEDLLPKLAAELVDIKPDVLVTIGEEPVRALMRATAAIPIVVLNVGDPVGTGLVKSLTRPGGNVTAVAHVAPALSAKRLELLKQLEPNISRVAMLWNPTNPHNTLQLRGTQDGAHALKINLQSIEIQSVGDLERAFTTMRATRVEGFTVAADNLLFNQRRQIVRLAEAHRLYGIYPDRFLPEVGGLMSYGPIFTAIWRHAGEYAGKILSGAKPSELPVLQPTKFELVINMRTAKALGLTVPPALLLRTDQVIE
jgi:putative ABC transport system substrate-binding protein